MTRTPFFSAVLLSFLFVARGTAKTRAQTAAAPPPPSQTETSTAAPVPAGEPDPRDLARTRFLIRSQFIRPDVRDDDLFYGSVAGMVRALHDPYSEFYDPKEAKELEEGLNGKFSGIGAELSLKNDLVVVVAPIAGSPAAAAGLRSGDIILAVDGQPVSGSRLFEVVGKIRGEIGTGVKLTLLRKGVKKPLEITVVRGEIQMESAKAKIEKVGRKKVMVITLSHFAEDSAEKVAGFAAEALEKRVDGIVLDLRDDPGGQVEAAVDISCLWNSDGPITVMVPRRGDAQELKCKKPAILGSMPTVVLVNHGSASASEITAGALQDYGKARVIGETTYGKGCGQSVMKYPDGSILKLTTFLWKTAKGRSIDKVGITPDEVLVAKPEDLEKGADPQMKRALEYLGQR